MPIAAEFTVTSDHAAAPISPKNIRQSVTTTSRNFHSAAEFREAASMANYTVVFGRRHDEQRDGLLHGNFISPCREPTNMGRYERSYAGERRTEKVTVQLMPSERAELEAAAELVGAQNLSIYVRELLFRRSAAVVAGTRRNPEANAIMREIDAAAGALNAAGNNLNQIARHLNATGELRDWGDCARPLPGTRKGWTCISRRCSGFLTCDASSRSQNPEGDKLQIERVVIAAGCVV